MRRRLLDHARGNPLALKRAVRALAERDGVPYAEARTRILAERAQTPQL